MYDDKVMKFDTWDEAQDKRKSLKEYSEHSGMFEGISVTSRSDGKRQIIKLPDKGNDVQVLSIHNEWMATQASVAEGQIYKETDNPDPESTGKYLIKNFNAKITDINDEEKIWDFPDGSQMNVETFREEWFTYET